MKTFISLGCFLTIFSYVSAQTIASENVKIIELKNPSNLYRLSIKTYRDGTLSRKGNTVTVSLLYGSDDSGYTITSILLGNTVLANNNPIETVELDYSNDEDEYVITSYIVGSNSDAVRGLIVYENSNSWRLVEIPSNKFEINKKSEDGKNYITFNDNEYSIERGMFIKQ